MKRILLTIVLLFGLSSPGFSEKIVLVADVWPPYNNALGDNDKGYIVDIAERIFAKNGHEVEYKILPWKVAIAETLKGTYDGLIGADAEDGAGFIFPQEEIGSYQIAFFVKKGNPWRFTNTRSLEKIKLGVAEGYGYNQWVHDYIQANKKNYTRVQSATGDHPLTVNIRKLIAGKIDATIAAYSTMSYSAKKLGVENMIQFAGTGGMGKKVYIVLSPNTKDSSLYAKMLDDGIREMRDSGELNEILARYGMKDWK